MPCYDSRNEPDYVRADAKREFQTDLDQLTRLLCEACNLLIANKAMFPASDELHNWYGEHCELDKKRSVS